MSALSTWSSAGSMTGNLIKGNISASSSGAITRYPLGCAHSMMPSYNFNSEQACNRVALESGHALQCWTSSAQARETVYDDVYNHMYVTGGADTSPRTDGQVASVPLQKEGR